MYLYLHNDIYIYVIRVFRTYSYWFNESPCSTRPARRLFFFEVIMVLASAWIHCTPMSRGGRVVVNPRLKVKGEMFGSHRNKWINHDRPLASDELMP